MILHGGASILFRPTTCEHATLHEMTVDRLWTCDSPQGYAKESTACACGMCDVHGGCTVAWSLAWKVHLDLSHPACLSRMSMYEHVGSCEAGAIALMSLCRIQCFPLRTIATGRRLSYTVRFVTQRCLGPYTHLHNLKTRLPPL